MLGIPSQFLCVVKIGVGTKHAFEVESGSVREELEMVRNGETFIL